jgi:quinoprotein glucose dehydrogenase
MPGNNGGANWGGAAIDPTNGTLYVVSKDLPSMLKLEPEEKRKASASDSPEQQGQFIYEANCQSCHRADRTGQPPVVPSLADVATNLTRDQILAVVTHGRGPMPGFSRLSEPELNGLIAYLFNPSRASANVAVPAAPSASPASALGFTRYYSGFGFMIASNGLAAIKPPWSSLTAYDLNQGTIKWKIPLGDVPDLAAKGIKNTGSHYPKVGPVVTAGGLIFTGTRDRKVRALDEETGKIIWEKEVDAALEGMPAVYEVNGREYVVFCAAAQVGITPSSQAKIQGAYVAFALPDNLK